MKLQWIVKAEESMPRISHGVIGKALGFVDGGREWHPATTAPFNQDLELRLAGHRRHYRLPFPCRNTRDGWMNSDLKVRIDLPPVEWRSWR
jgi:hypothetical protein